MKCSILLFRGMALSALLLLVAGPANAQSRFWGGNDAAKGGSGTWTSTSNTWAATDASPYNVTTSSGTNNNNFFGGTAGTVTVDGTIDFRSMVFETNGYSVVGGTSPLLQRTSDLVLRTTGANVTANLSGLGFNKSSGGSQTIFVGLNTTTETNVGTVVFSNNTLGSQVALIALRGGTLVLGDGNTFAGAGSTGVQLSSGFTSTLAFANTGVGALFGDAGRNIDLGSGNYTLRSADSTARTIANALDLDTTPAISFGDPTNNGKLTFTTSSIALGNISHTFDVAANSAVEFTGVVSSTGTSGSLLKAGAGSLILSGANTYTGATSVNAGELIVGVSHTGAGNYDVAGGARLGGDGAVSLAGTNTIDVAVGGEVSPGFDSATGSSYSAGADSNTVGQFSVDGDVVFDGNLLVDLISTTNADLLKITNGNFDIGSDAQLEINGETDLSMINFLGLGFMMGDRVDLVMADAISGDFANLISNQTYLDANGLPILFGNDGTTLFLQVVPEPTSLAMWMLLGAMGAILFWRRRRATAA